MTTLGFERGSQPPPATAVLRSSTTSSASQGRGKEPTPIIRQRLARTWSNIKIMEITATLLTDALNGDPSDRGAGRVQQDVLVREPPTTMELANGHPRDGRPILQGRESIECSLGCAVGRSGLPSTSCKPPSSSRARDHLGGAAEDPANIVGERSSGSRRSQVEAKQA